MNNARWVNLEEFLVFMTARRLLPAQGSSLGHLQASAVQCTKPQAAAFHAVSALGPNLCQLTLHLAALKSCSSGTSHCVWQAAGIWR